MSPSLKILHDAMLIVTRELTRAENDLKLSSTDANDSEENFQRRLTNIEQQQDKLQAQVAQLLGTFDALEVERLRMIAARSDGLAALRQKIRQFTVNKATIQLAILQTELNT